MFFRIVFTGFILSVFAVSAVVEAKAVPSPEGKSFFHFLSGDYQKGIRSIKFMENRTCEHSLHDMKSWRTVQCTWTKKGKNLTVKIPSSGTSYDLKLEIVVEKETMRLKEKQGDQKWSASDSRLPEWEGRVYRGMIGKTESTLRLLKHHVCQVVNKDEGRTDILFNCQWYLFEDEGKLALMAWVSDNRDWHDIEDDGKTLRDGDIVMTLVE